MTRGPKKHLKRLNAPKHWWVSRVRVRAPSPCVRTHALLCAHAPPGCMTAAEPVPLSSFTHAQDAGQAWGCLREYLWHVWGGCLCVLLSACHRVCMLMAAATYAPLIILGVSLCSCVFSPPSHRLPLPPHIAHTQAPKPTQGPHKLRECLPLLLVIRNRLKWVSCVCVRAGVCAGQDWEHQQGSAHTHMCLREGLSAAAHACMGWQEQGGGR